MYNVYVNNTLVKSYPFRIQAVIYCYMNGYVYEGGYDFDNRWYRVLDPRVKIREVRYGKTNRQDSFVVMEN